MLFFIIPAAVGLIALSLMVFSFICYEKNIGPATFRVEETWWTASGGVSGVFIGVALIIGGVQLLENNSYKCNLVRMHYEERVEQLNNTYNTLITLNTNDNNLLRLEVVSYNEQVRKFKEDIREQQLALENPWVNWFVTKEYANLDANVVSYIK